MFDCFVLQCLFMDIDVGWVDLVVVYKVDWLMWFLFDFVKFIECLDVVGVFFVFVIQLFNILIFMGCFILNVLFFFVQFEWEVMVECI